MSSPPSPQMRECNSAQSIIDMMPDYIMFFKMLPIVLMTKLKYGSVHITYKYFLKMKTIQV